VKKQHLLRILEIIQSEADITGDEEYATLAHSLDAFIPTITCPHCDATLQVQQCNCQDHDEMCPKTTFLPLPKDFPANAFQCDDCGGLGCSLCGNDGWTTNAAHARRCLNCNTPLSPDNQAVYCSNQCANEDVD
jgi:hypothetical protein